VLGEPSGNLLHNRVVAGVPEAVPIIFYFRLIVSTFWIAYVLTNGEQVIQMLAFWRSDVVAEIQVDWEVDLLIFLLG